MDDAFQYSSHQCTVVLFSDSAFAATAAAVATAAVTAPLAFGVGGTAHVGVPMA